MNIAFLIGVMAIAFDLASGARARAKLIDWLLREWHAIEAADLLTAFRRTSDLVYRGMRRVLGTSRAPVRLLTSTIVLGMTLAATCLALATWATDQSLRETFPRAVSYYAGPTVVACACALGLLYHHAARASEARSVARLLASLLGVVLGSGLLWLAAMHAGTWHEWQFRRSPLAYGSAWFYAEVYHDLFTGGIGSAVSLAMALTLAVPVGLHTVTLLAVTVLKLTAPVLAPLSIALARGYRHLPRGALAAVITVILAGLLALGRGPSVGTGPSLPGRSAPDAELSVVVVHVGPRIGNEAVSVRHLHLR